MSTTFIALDPGGTTGWVRYRPNDPQGKQFVCGQMGPLDHHSQLFAHLENSATSHYVVICESFEFRQNRQRDNINLMSREYIGVVKLFGQERHLSVVFQTAAMAKGFVSDEKLKVMGLWVPGHKHAMDAMRHLIYHLVNTQGQRDLILPWKDL